MLCVPTDTCSSLVVGFVASEAALARMRSRKRTSRARRGHSEVAKAHVHCVEFVDHSKKQTTANAHAPQLAPSTGSQLLNSWFLAHVHNWQSLEPVLIERWTVIATHDAVGAGWMHRRRRRQLPWVEYFPSSHPEHRSAPSGRDTVE